MKLIGYCKDCKFYTPPMATTERYRNARCENTVKLDEGRGEDDTLGYPYYEGGWFIPGPNFGCVHWEAK